MMKKDTNTMINLDVKSNLAKLLATENITIQHNKVQTASFDVKNRILTLPIFEEQKGDVYDMLIAHEVSHALYTPSDSWEEIASDNELRSYVNVIEDTRIDKLIQAKYPGVVKNYMNGFDILDKKNFFGLVGKNINKDLMIIDKINLRSKSLNRLPFEFNDQDNEWLKKVDAVKTFDDVVALAKEMIAWQKEQVEEMKKLPDFDELSISKVYDLGDDEDDFGDDVSFADEDENQDKSDEKNDFNNFGDQEADDEKDATQSGPSDKVDDENKEEEKGGSPEQYSNGAGGEQPEKLLRSVTNDHYEEKQKDLLNKKAKGFTYGTMPEPNLESIIGYKEYLKQMQDHRNYQVKQGYGYNDSKYMPALKDAYKKFVNENKKTVMYLVKEFEMKKSAQAYKRASTDKTGIIDPLKLHKYKHTEDIFKRMTIVPDGKNHGMMMLLDWSGSMSDTLENTVDQLLNLVQFVRKVNIPFEVYFFTSERREKQVKSFNYKNGDWQFEDFNLVNCFSHRMTKKEFELACMYMFHMGKYFSYNYTYHRKWNEEASMFRYESFGTPSQFYLGNTPLNESLIFMNKLVPMFKKKYDIEKMTFITLTDGGANSFRGYQIDTSKELGVTDKDYDTQTVIQIGKRKIITGRYSSGLTAKLLKLIRVENNTNNVGFYILKRVKRWDIEKYCEGSWNEREKQYATLRKEMTRDKAIAIKNDGYNKYFLLDGKKMQVENFSLDDAEIKKETVGEFKKVFGKAMQNRLVSRVVLNKFIQEVA